MSQGAKITRSQERAVTAFEVEVETLWVRLTRLRPGKAVDVWLTPNWALAARPHPMSTKVGTYTCAVTLQHLRDDCFWMLSEAKGKR